MSVPSTTSKLHAASAREPNIKSQRRQAVREETYQTLHLLLPNSLSQPSPSQLNPPFLHLLVHHKLNRTVADTYQREGHPLAETADAFLSC